MMILTPRDKDLFVFWELCRVSHYEVEAIQRMRIRKEPLDDTNKDYVESIEQLAAVQMETDGLTAVYLALYSTQEFGLWVSVLSDVNRVALEHLKDGRAIPKVNKKRIYDDIMQRAGR